jgi:hypothetical protein
MAELRRVSHCRRATRFAFRRASRGYNPQPMKSRRLLSVALAILLAASSGEAVAQGFISESSGKRLPDTATTQSPESPPVSEAPAVASESPPVPGAPAMAPESPPAPEAAADTNPVTSSAGDGGVEPAPSGPAATAPFGGSYADAVAASPGKLETADHVLVKKAERRLYLLRADRVIAEYPIKLGLSPKGPKLYEGDFRTPEGRYALVARNQHSDYFLSLRVSYPNEDDLVRARELGLRPGGLIMIHGQPNTPRKPRDWYAGNDWTDGCIAVSNSDMVDIWLRTTVGMPIEIRP